VKDKVVEVQVPYDGDGSMFNYRPSSAKELSEPVQLETGHLKYTMPFDPGQQERYNGLLKSIEHNLDAMRRDEEAFNREAVDRLKKVAEDRRKQVEEDANSRAVHDRFPRPRSHNITEAWPLTSRCCRTCEDVKFPASIGADRVNRRYGP
jgi:hypothetical protein